MAYVPSSLDAQGDEQKRLNISGTSAGPAPTSSSSAPASSNAPAAPSGASGGFTNIRDYLGANQAGARGLGETVANKITKEGDEASSAITTGDTATRAAITAGTNTYNQGAFDRLTSTGTQDAAATRMLSGTYGGPTSLTNRDNIDRELSEATKYAGLAGTEGGRVELLRELTGRPQTTGVTRLNSALLQGNADARGLVTGAVGKVNPLTGQLETAAQTAARLAGEARTTNEATRTRVVTGLGSYLDTEDQAAQARLDSTKATETAKANAATAYLRRLAAFGADAGRSQAGGSGGLVDTSTPEGRMRALDVGPPTPTSTPGRATIQAANRDGDRYRVFGPGEREEMLPSRPVPVMGPARPPGIPEQLPSRTPTENAIRDPSPPVPVMGPARPPGMEMSEAEIRAQALPLLDGYEAAGFSPMEGRLLQNAAYSNRAEGGAAVDLSRYYTPSQIASLTRANAITPEQATRLTALARIIGRDAYTSADAGLRSSADYDGALAALRASREAAIAARPTVTVTPPLVPIIEPPRTQPPPGGSYTPPPPVNDGGMGGDGTAAGSPGGPAPGATTGPGTAEGGVTAEGGTNSQGQNAAGTDASDGGSNASDGTSSSTGSGADAAGGVGGSGQGDTAGIGSTAGSGNDGTDGDGVGGVSSNGDDGSSDGGGGGGGGGKIICTMMNDFYCLPYNENKVWLKYSKTHLKPEHQVGYHKVFLPLIAFAKQPGFLNSKVRDVLFWIGKNRTLDIQDELAGRNPRPIKRALLRKPAEAALAFIGKVLK